MEINNLIQKYISGTLSDSEAEILADWVDDSRQNAEYFRMTCKSFESVHPATDESKMFWKRFRKRFQTNGAAKRSRLAIISATFAACIVIAVICTTVFFGVRENSTEDGSLETGSEELYASTSTDNPIQYSSPAVQYVSSTGEHKSITLPDGSKVILNSNSRLTLCEGFNEKERRVTLCGEAYFDVVKSDIKFIVQTNGKDFIVHGTSFNIFDYDNNQFAIVTLHSGKLEARVMDSAYMLKPGEELRVDDSENSISKHNVDISNSVSWINRELRFSRLPLKYVASQLSQKFDVKIKIHSSIEDIVYTGQLKDENLATALNLLSIAAPVKIVITEFKGEYYISQRDDN